ncbi:MAG: DUF3823 domain-containing protein [Ginsengibacter sp.]
MKHLFRYGFILTLLITVFSCKKDNYSAPGTFLTGALLYNGDSIYVERNQVTYQIYQYGFGSVGPIGGSFAQDGTFSQVLFNGDYKFIISNGQGPFLWKQTSSGAPDSLAISLKGNQNIDLQVTPYYIVRNAQFTYTGSDTSITATFKADKIITDPAMAKDIERVSIYVNKTQFVSGGDNVALNNMPGGAITDPNSITLKVNMGGAVRSFVPSQNYVFVRVGIKIVGVEDMIFSPLKMVTF